jgi:serine protease Do
MKNIFNIYKNNLVKFFRLNTVKIVVTSLVTFIVLFVISFGLLWFYRDDVSNYIVENYLEKSEILNKKENTVTFKEEEKPKLIDQIIKKDEDTVITAVKKARPAVVSIIGYKEVPKYKISYKEESATDSWGSLIPGFFIQTPIYTQDGTEKKQIGSGSGFLITSDGLIVTNRHVVSGTATEYKVLLNNGKEYIATILAKDPVLDVALIKITATGLPYLNLANSDTLEVGQSVVAIGNALGEFQNTVSAGVISDLSRSITANDSSGQQEYLDKVIQTDAAINPGNSGGPLLNLKGEVVGINVAVAQGSSSIGFSLPINSVKNAIESVKKTGKIVRPYVGVRYITVNDELKKKNNLAVDYGILVQRGKTTSEVAVIPGSPADKAGIVENDIILEIDGVKIDENQSFLYMIRNKKVGDTISMKILSNGVYKTVYLVLDAASDGQ